MARQLEWLATSGPGLTAGHRIYAIGDIHGRADCLDLLLAKIAADIAARPVDRVTEVYLGDYIDRGPDSRGVVERLQQPALGSERILIRGNHEAMAADFCRNPDSVDNDVWLRNGGFATLLSYGANHIRPTGIEPLATFVGGSALRSHWRCDGYFFTHAGIDPFLPLDRQSYDKMMWIREPFLSSAEDYGAVIVHGHTPHGEVEIRPNRINLDTMAFRTGILSCGIFEENRFSIISSSGEAVASRLAQSWKRFMQQP